MTLPNTERLYYDDAYTTRFTAHIVERIAHEGVFAVALDRTYFYPTGGGQPHDTGTIGGLPVLDVFTRDQAVYHVIPEPIPVNADAVACEIDWRRRFDHMQQHTGQHILSQAFFQTAGANTVGFHLSGESLTVDLDTLALDPAALDAAETLSNQAIWDDLPVTAAIIDPAQAELFGVRMRKLPEQMATAGLRIIRIGTFDVTACGGTHVARTGAVGLIKIVRVEKKGDRLRIEFVCGGRALRDFRHEHQIVAQLAAELTCSTAELPVMVNRLRDDVQAVSRQLKTAAQQLIALEAEALIAAHPLIEGRRMIVRIFENRPVDEVRSLVIALAAVPGTIVLFGIPGEKAQLIFARSADLSADMNALVKSALAAFGGRGGGQPGMAQGGGVPASTVQVEAALQTAQSALEPT